MSQKAWMNAYTKGSKSLQDKLARVHAKNPEFQEFLKHHGMGANLSVKQSGIQKKSVATVKPVTDASPEKNVGSREAIIKAAAEKIRDRRHAASNRSSFGGELGGGFSMPGGGFRRYSEGWDESNYKWSEQSTEWKEKVAKEKKAEAMRKAFPRKTSFATGLRNAKRVQKTDESVAANFRAVIPGLGKLQAKNRALDIEDELNSGIKKGRLTRKQIMNKAKHIERFARVASGGSAFHKEDIAYKDGQIAMYKGGWIAKRDGKRLGTVVPTEDHAKHYIDSTRKSLGQKTMEILKRKSREIARGLGHNAMAVEAVSGVSYEGLKRLSKKPTKAEREYMKNDPENQASFERIRKSFAKRANVAYLGGKKVRTESAANRRRIRSWDSAILPVEHDHPLTSKPKSKPPFTPDKPKKNLGVVVGKNDPGYSRARHLARLGLKKAMANEAQDPKVLALRAAGKHEEARKIERAALAKGFAAAKRDTLNKPGEKRKPDQEQLRIDSQKWHNGD